MFERETGWADKKKKRRTLLEWMKVIHSNIQTVKQKLTMNLCVMTLPQ
jgi:hypothetical protein